MEKLIYKQVEEYYDYCANIRRFSPQTLKVKRSTISRFLRFVEISSLEDVSNELLNAWISELREHGLTGRSINDYLCQVVALLKYERDSGVNMPNLNFSRIVKQKEEPPRKVYYTREQVEKVLSFADQREWLLIKLCFDCGLRVSELCNIRLADIDGRTIQIIGKGRKKRFVCMSEEARRALRTWISSKGITDYLWPSQVNASRPLSQLYIRDIMCRPFIAAGFDNFYPHALRHSFATDLQRNGASIGEIRIALGHSNTSTTERYMHDLDGRDVSEIWDTYKFRKRNLHHKMFKRIFKTPIVFHRRVWYNGIQERCVGRV